MKFLKRLFAKKPESARPPGLAGHFYPADPGELEALVTGQLGAPSEAPAPKVLIAPFAELSVMGHVVGPAYDAVAAHAEDIARVVIVSSALRVPFQGVAVSARDAFSSPLGHLWLDRDAAQNLVTQELSRAIDAVHDPEPAIELHLPYLRHVLGPDTKLVPMLMGDGKVDGLLPALEAVWGGPETLILVLTELSREVDVAEYERLDAETLEEVLALRGDAISRNHASARVPLRAALALAKARGLTPKVLAQGHSGEITGEHDAVVGYASIGLYPGA